MRLKASKRLLAPLVAVALLLPLGFAAAEEGGGLGDLFRELLGGDSDQGTPPAAQPAQPSPGTGQPATTTQAAPPPAGSDKRVPFGREEMELSFAPLVKNTAPAVVNVYASQQVRARSPFEGDPFFEQFFGDQQMAPRMQQSLGSGVLVDPTGIVVTNYHVIRDADTVKVATSCSPWAIRSASARRRPAGSSPRLPARISGFPISASSSRRTRPSIRAIPAAR
jgi:S1-C subfamily serine protease